MCIIAVENNNGRMHVEKSGFSLEIIGGREVFEGGGDEIGEGGQMNGKVIKNIIFKGSGGSGDYNIFVVGLPSTIKELM